jgi:hypothetical protein
MAIHSIFYIVERDRPICSSTITKELVAAFREQ